MFNVTPENLLAEIRAAEAVRDRSLADLDKQIKKYTQVAKGQDSAPENHGYDYISLVLPRLVLDNPRVRIKSRRAGDFRQVSEAMQYGMNRWIRNVDVAETLIRVAMDMLFGFGVSVTTQTPQPGFDPREPSSRFWPMVSRISPRRFFLDPLCLYWGEARFGGHQWVRDKDDLLNEAAEDPASGWNVEEIHRIASDSGVDELPDRKGKDNGTDQPTRNEITGYEVWFPQVVLPESPGPDGGCHGTIYTLGHCAGSDKADSQYGFIRKPRPYYGPRWGPYSVFGAYIVPDSPYPLSPLAATRLQADELNDYARSIQRSARRYKRLVFVDAANPKLADQVKRAEHDFVIPVQGLNKEVVLSEEIGGITAQMLEMMNISRERLERSSGISDAMRGNADSGATATADNIAEGASNTRLAYLRNRFTAATTVSLETAAWFMFHNDSIQFHLGEDEANALGMYNPLFMGGNQQAGSGARYDDLELEIEPYSMARVSESGMKQEFALLFQTVMQMAQAIPMMPYVDWDLMIRKAGDAFNTPDMDGLVNVQMAQMMTMGMPMGGPQVTPMLTRQRTGGPSGGNPQRGGFGQSGPQQRPLLAAN